MNIDLDFSIVSRFFRGILRELHQKRLWPVAVALLVAVVAVPLLLSKSAKPAPVAQAPVVTPPPAPATTLPTLNVQSTPTISHLRGPSHDPFSEGSLSSLAQTASVATSVAHTVGTSTASGGAGTSAGSGASGSGSGSSSTSSSSSSSGTSPGNPPSITPNAKPKPAPSGLSSTQAYDVALSITTPDGGVAPIDPLERLTELPNDQQPLVVELGVLEGGSRVMFAVQPGTVVNGPGACLPGPIDCEILSLGQDQTESLSAQGPTGLSQVALFAVTGISATNYSSAAAADKARRAASSSGRALLAKSTLPTLSLFQYEPSLGVVVDQRNLTVGG
jgi:hypothetical protein